MLTENNYVIISNSYGKEYQKLPITQISKKTSILTLSLPSGLNPMYFAFMRDFEVEEVVDHPIVRWTLENNRGEQYVIEGDDETLVYNNKLEWTYNNNTERKVPVYRFDSLGKRNDDNMWYFTTFDWMGLYCKIIKVERDLYTGKMYKITSKKTDNVIVSGIPVESHSSEVDDEDDDIEVLTETSQD
jgi:hypothetical protein